MTMHHTTSLTTVLALSFIGLAGCRNATATPKQGSVQVRVLGPEDLATNVSEAHRVTWDRPVRAATGEQLPAAEVLDALRRSVRVVEWPSGRDVPGRWITVPADDVSDRPSLSFQRSGKPGAGWEALIVDRSLLPAQFQDSGVAGATQVQRYSPTSRPFVSEIFSTRLDESDDGTTSGYPPVRAGNDMVSVRFSEPVGSLSSAFGYVKLEAVDQSAQCRPHAPVQAEDVPVTVLQFQCAPLAQGHRLRVRVDGRLVSKAGVSLASAVGRAAAEETAVDVTLDGNDVGRIAADPRVFETAAKIPSLRGVK